MNQFTRAGCLLVDKSAGMTSHDVVTWARRCLGVRRIGHAGTLDPFATGLLPCLIGPATRLVPYLHGWSKTYVGIVRLGEETSTGDIESATECPRAPIPPPEALAAVRRRFLGRQLQVPPAYSAKKIGGVASYRLSRMGFPPTLPARQIVVHAFRLSARKDGDLAFAARVSTGTYLRAVARDVGRFLGTGAHLRALRRVAIGPMRVREAVVADPGGPTPSIATHVLALDRIPLPLPTVRISGESAQSFRHGARQALAEPIAGPARVMGADGELLGIGTVEEGVLQPVVVFPA